MIETGPSAPAADSALAAVLRLATAYHASRALHVGVRLGLPDLLVDGPRSAEELAAAISVHAPSLRRLMRVLVAFDVFVEETEGGRFALGPLGGLLRTGGHTSLRDFVLMIGHEDLWRTWGELESCIRTGETAAKLLYGDGDPFARYVADPDFGPIFNAAMSALSAVQAKAIVAAYDVSRHSNVVDVGGGEGRLLAEILQANQDVRGILFDLPSVAQAATPILDEAGVADRCDIVAGDMFRAIPQGGDLYLLKAVLHDWTDEAAIALLANCRVAMGESGTATLLIIEHLLPERIEPLPALQPLVLNDLNMLVRTGGRNRTAAEFRGLLHKAGLNLTRIRSTGAHLDLIEAVSC